MEVEEESWKPAEMEEESSKPAVSDQMTRQKVQKRCKFPECDHVFKGRHFVQKRHVRTAHLPWFTTMHHICSRAR